MDSLHAPWRIEYILSPKPPVVPGTSLFADIARSEDDVAHHVILRGRSCFALLNTYPYNGGHVLVVPYKCVSDLNGLTADEMSELFLMVRRCQNALSRVMKPQGFNIGLNLGKVAGAGVEEHLHVHIVPRWLGDTNFMPVLGQTNVLPQALADVAARLRQALAEDPA